MIIMEFYENEYKKLPMLGMKIRLEFDKISSSSTDHNLCCVIESPDAESTHNSLNLEALNEGDRSTCQKFYKY